MMRDFKIGTTITERTPELNRYLAEINRYPLLTTDEEVALAQRIKQGDEAALNKLVNCNLRFVVSVARQYQHQGLPLLDLIQEGNAGLIKAAHKFDETRGFKFISYAVWWIRQAIMQALDNQPNAIRVPANVLALRKRIWKTASDFALEHNRQLNTEELAKALNVTEEKIMAAMRLNNRTASLDTPLTDEQSGTLLDVLPDNGGSRADDQVNRDSLKALIDNALNNLLQPRERQVVRAFFGLGGREMTLEEIGDQFDLTRERVRQIREKALRQLRRQQQLFAPYLN